jgi:hypothetical protein
MQHIRSSTATSYKKCLAIENTWAHRDFEPPSVSPAAVRGKAGTSIPMASLHRAR